VVDVRTGHGHFAFRAASRQDADARPTHGPSDADAESTSCQWPHRNEVGPAGGRDRLGLGRPVDDEDLAVRQKALKRLDKRDRDGCSTGEQSSHARQHDASRGAIARERGAEARPSSDQRHAVLRDLADGVCRVRFERRSSPEGRQDYAGTRREVMEGEERQPGENPIACAVGKVRGERPVLCPEQCVRSARRFRRPACSARVGDERGRFLIRRRD
jgi:hypothetical protein